MSCHVDDDVMTLTSMVVLAQGTGESKAKTPSAQTRARGASAPRVLVVSLRVVVRVVVRVLVAVVVVGALKVVIVKSRCTAPIGKACETDRCFEALANLIVRCNLLL